MCNVIWPIIAALLQACSFVHMPEDSWQCVNNEQTVFMESFYYPRKSQVTYFSDEELRSWVSTDNKELNKIAAKEGFSIELAPFAPGGFGVLSILEIAVSWLAPKDAIAKTVVVNNDEEYPAVRMAKEFEVFTFDKHDNFVIKLKTQTDDTVWMTIGSAPERESDVLKQISDIRNNLTKAPTRNDEGELISYPYVKFPMIDLNYTHDISWLEGMSMGGYYTAEAKQQTIFKMNEEGAHAKSAVLVSLERCIRQQPILVPVVIDKPFYLWIERPGLSEPIVAAYITQDFWKDPKGLDNAACAK